MVNVARRNVAGVDVPLTPTQVAKVQADLKLPSSVKVFEDLMRRLREPRGISERQQQIDDFASAGISTALMVPPGDFNVVTLADYNSAVASASAGQVIRWAENSTVLLTAQPAPVPPGVTLVSGGNVSIIVGYTPSSSTTPTSAIFRLQSSVEGTDGNQSIQGFRFYGNGYLGALAIYVQGRSNVTISDCTITEFNYSAITFNGRGDEVDGVAGLRASGNSVRNCHIFSCSTWIGTAPAGYASGCLQLGSQTDFEVISTNIICKGRPSGLNGYGMKPYRNGYNDGTLIKNCYMAKSVDDGTPSDFGFVVEDWGSRGLQVYNSEFEGWFDLNGTVDGLSYTFGARFAGNVFGTDSLPVRTTGPFAAIELECGFGTGGAPCRKIIVENNIFKNVINALYIYQKAGTGSQQFARIVFRNNYCWNTRLWEFVAAANEGGTNLVTVEHNTFRAADSYYLHAYVKIPELGQNNNWKVRYNVGENARVGPVFQAATTAGATTGIDISDNIWNTTLGYPLTNSIATAITGLTTDRNRNIAPQWKAAGSLEQLYQGSYGADKRAGQPVAF